MSDAAPALVCRGLVHVYRVEGTDVAALRGIDLVVPEGQRVALLGPSGSGKSTLFAVLAGILRPSAGTALVFGTDLGKAGRRRLRTLRGSTLGLMLQGASRNLLPFEDALGNVRAAVRDTGHVDDSLGRAMLDAGGIEAHGGPAAGLPPRDQQVVALAVALSTRPRLLLADEPTSRLDDESRDRVLDLLVDVTAREGTTVLVVTHDPAVANRMQRMIHLRDGRIAEEASGAGRFAVIGADGSVQLPVGAERSGWAPGALVAIDMSEPGEIRIRPAASASAGPGTPPD